MNSNGNSPFEQKYASGSSQSMVLNTSMSQDFIQSTRLSSKPLLRNNLQFLGDVKERISLNDDYQYFDRAKFAKTFTNEDYQNLMHTSQTFEATTKKEKEKDQAVVPSINNNTNNKPKRRLFDDDLPMYESINTTQLIHQKRNELEINENDEESEAEESKEEKQQQQQKNPLRISQSQQQDLYFDDPTFRNAQAFLGLSLSSSMNNEQKAINQPTTTVIQNNNINSSTYNNPNKKHSTQQSQHIQKFQEGRNALLISQTITEEDKSMEIQEEVRGATAGTETKLPTEPATLRTIKDKDTGSLSETVNFSLSYSSNKRSLYFGKPFSLADSKSLQHTYSQISDSSNIFSKIDPIPNEPFTQPQPEQRPKANPKRADPQFNRDSSETQYNQNLLGLTQDKQMPEQEQNKKNVPQERTIIPTINSNYQKYSSNNNNNNIENVSSTPTTPSVTALNVKLPEKHQLLLAGRESAVPTHRTIDSAIQAAESIQLNNLTTPTQNSSIQAVPDQSPTHTQLSPQTQRSPKEFPPSQRSLQTGENTSTNNNINNNNNESFLEEQEENQNRFNPKQQHEFQQELPQSNEHSEHIKLFIWVSRIEVMGSNGMSIPQSLEFQVQLLSNKFTIADEAAWTDFSIPSRFIPDHTFITCRPNERFTKKSLSLMHEKSLEDHHLHIRLLMDEQSMQAGSVDTKNIQIIFSDFEQELEHEQVPFTGKNVWVICPVEISGIHSFAFINLYLSLNDPEFLERHASTFNLSESVTHPKYARNSVQFPRIRIEDFDRIELLIDRMGFTDSFHSLRSDVFSRLLSRKQTVKERFAQELGLWQAYEAVQSRILSRLFRQSNEYQQKGILAGITLEFVREGIPGEFRQEMYLEFLGNPIIICQIRDDFIAYATKKNSTEQWNPNELNHVFVDPQLNSIQVQKILAAFHGTSIEDRNNFYRILYLEARHYEKDIQVGLPEQYKDIAKSISTVLSFVLRIQINRRSLQYFSVIDKILEKCLAVNEIAESEFQESEAFWLAFAIMTKFHSKTALASLPLYLHMIETETGVHSLSKDLGIDCLIGLFSGSFHLEMCLRYWDVLFFKAFHQSYQIDIQGYLSSTAIGLCNQYKIEQILEWTFLTSYHTNFSELHALSSSTFTILLGDSASRKRTTAKFTQSESTRSSSTQRTQFQLSTLQSYFLATDSHHDPSRHLTHTDFLHILQHTKSTHAASTFTTPLYLHSHITSIQGLLNPSPFSLSLRIGTLETQSPILRTAQNPDFHSSIECNKDNAFLLIISLLSTHDQTNYETQIDLRSFNLNTIFQSEFFMQASHQDAKNSITHSSSQDLQVQLVITVTLLLQPISLFEMTLKNTSFESSVAYSSSRTISNDVCLNSICTNATQPHRIPQFEDSFNQQTLFAAGLSHFIYSKNILTRHQDTYSDTNILNQNYNTNNTNKTTLFNDSSIFPDHVQQIYSQIAASDFTEAVELFLPYIATNFNNKLELLFELFTLRFPERTSEDLESFLLDLCLKTSMNSFLSFSAIKKSFQSHQQQHFNKSRRSPAFNNSSSEQFKLISATLITNNVEIDATDIFTTTIMPSICDTYLINSIDLAHPSIIGMLKSRIPYSNRFSSPTILRVEHKLNGKIIQKHVQFTFHAETNSWVHDLPARKAKQPNNTTTTTSAAVSQYKSNQSQYNSSSSQRMNHSEINAISNNNNNNNNYNSLKRLLESTMRESVWVNFTEFKFINDINDFKHGVSGIIDILEFYFMHRSPIAHPNSPLHLRQPIILRVNPIAIRTTIVPTATQSDLQPSFFCEEIFANQLKRYFKTESSTKNITLLPSCDLDDSLLDILSKTVLQMLNISTHQISDVDLTLSIADIPLTVRDLNKWITLREILRSNPTNNNMIIPIKVIDQSQETSQFNPMFKFTRAQEQEDFNGYSLWQIAGMDQLLPCYISNEPQVNHFRQAPIQIYY